MLNAMVVVKIKKLGNFDELTSTQLARAVGGSKSHRHSWYWSIKQFGAGFIHGLCSKYSLINKF